MMHMMLILLIYAFGGLWIFILVEEFFEGKCKRNILILGISVFLLGYLSIYNYGKKVIIIENAKSFNISLETLNTSLVDNGFKPLGKIPY